MWMFGHLIINAVFVAIAVNYCTQCQLLICFVRAVLLSIAERSVDLKTLMKVRVYMMWTNMSSRDK